MPIYVAAAAPKALAIAGELGDGIITISILSPDMLQSALATAAKGKEKAVVKNADWPVVTVGVSCVVRPGEGLDSPRVITRVGPRIAVALHFAHEVVKQGKAAPVYMQPFLTPEYQAYLDERWEEIHATHSRFLHPGEEKFITPDAIKAMSLTGTREEIIDRIKQLEAVGLTQMVISPPWGYVEESIVEFAQEIIAHY